MKGIPRYVASTHATQFRYAGPHNPGTQARYLLTTYYSPAAGDALDACYGADGGDAASEALQLVEAVDGHREVPVELVRVRVRVRVGAG
eukprot:scaffold104245_cov45-Phaeocystis_antarctica.AAC.1